MGTLLSEVTFDNSDPKPVEMGEGDDKQTLIGFSDFNSSTSNIKASVGQIVTQHNKALLEQEKTISANIPSELDTGTATAADCAAAINNIITILTNLNTQPK